MQGGLDGGIDIPHSEKRFIGYDRESKKLDAETLQKYIYGGNVGEYMEWLQEENGDKYHTHFKQALAEDLDADSLEDMYKEVGPVFFGGGGGVIGRLLKEKGAMRFVWEVGGAWVVEVGGKGWC